MRRVGQVAPHVSIIIKALNEEDHIEKAIESAIAAISDFSGEVILADSCSTDRTIELASRYPITIVQLGNCAEKCCGIGPQLGYHVAKGEYIYILDGDMELYPKFLQHAIALMHHDPTVGAVAGLEEIIGGQGYELEIRKKQTVGRMYPGLQSWLDCGGLYRRSALNALGYFTNRNLHSFEEMDLGLRLTSAGWRLQRLNEPAFKHHVHNDDSFRLMKRRWISRYVDGAGELLHAAVGKPYLLTVLWRHKMYAAFSVYWLLFAGTLFVLPISPFPTALLSVALVAFTVVQIIRKGSISNGIFSVLNLQVYTAGWIRGLVRKQVNPEYPVDYIVLQNSPEDGANNMLPSVSTKI
ncbi:glycosyltransferase family 2 protein [Parasulfuritortus cantonensis]|uniref:Glycosyltransferase family 2 protein n=1 Tax=Parasulfuritortus cantonensis TaxID=2528202 RepID=A0A4R1BKS8_9PROT|nr:glycosyltransferase family A protein [Parasulfuritortus cantonensis]TCJ17939.1 glycosyltransferase family 2 protein [Parasulfuritortus cantonensis]